MSGGLWWTVALAGLVCMLFFLTLVPALVELHRPRDVAPLKVVREHDGNVINFAKVFEQFAEARVGKFLSGLAAGEIRSVCLDSGAHCILLGQKAGFPMDEIRPDALTVAKLIAGAGTVRLPEHVLFESEVFAGGDFEGGRHSAFRAVLARGTAALAGGSVVLRWIHSHGTLSVANEAHLFGRASSESRIELGTGVEFERLFAPVILFGMADEGAATPDIFPAPVCAWPLPANGEIFGGQWRVKGEAVLPPASACAVALVAIGNLRVGAGSWLGQALKSNGELVLDDDCRVDGAVVAKGRVDVGAGCRIKGPIISEAEVLLRRGSVVGSSAHPATISAPRVVIEAGVTVFGTVWARDKGEVRAVL